MVYFGSRDDYKAGGRIHTLENNFTASYGCGQKNLLKALVKVEAHRPAAGVGTDDSGQRYSSAYSRRLCSQCGGYFDENFACVQIYKIARYDNVSPAL